MSCEGWLRVERLSLYGFHGVLPEERRTGGLFEVSVAVAYPLEEPAREERLEKAVDYIALIRVIEEVNERRRYRLLEAFAVELAETILARFPRVREVRLEVRKCTPRLPQKMDAIAVEVRKRRE